MNINQKLGREQKKMYICLMLIIILGALMRIIGSNWGFPSFLHPDEPVIINAAVDMAKRKSFEPGVFFRPDHLTIQINMIISSIYSFIIYKVPLDQAFIKNPQIFYLIGRLITASFGTGMIFMAYLIGSKQKKEIGLIAAFLFAVYPSFIEHSHYVTPDIPITFMLMVIIYFAILYLDDASVKNLLCITLFTAAAITIKYPGAIGCLLIAVVVSIKSLKLKSWKLFLKHGIISVSTVVLFVFLISPVLITNYTATAKAFINETGSAHLGADGLGLGGNMLFYLKQYLLNSKVILVIPCMVGLFVVFKNKIIYAIPMCLGIIYWIIMSNIALHWERWALPMYTAPLLLTAIGIYYIYEFININIRCNKKKYYKIFIAIVISLSSVSFITNDIVVLINFLVQDSRVLSQKYCKENKINTENTAYEGYTPLMAGVPKNVFDEFIISDGKLLLKKSNIEYIALSSTMYSRYKKEPQKYVNQVNIYNLLDEQYELKKKYTSVESKTSNYTIPSIFYCIKYIKEVREVGFTGPEIRLYKVKPEQHVR